MLTPTPTAGPDDLDQVVGALHVAAARLWLAADQDGPRSAWHLVAFTVQLIAHRHTPDHAWARAIDIATVAGTSTSETAPDPVTLLRSARERADQAATRTTITAADRAALVSLVAELDVVIEEAQTHAPA